MSKRTFNLKYNILARIRRKANIISLSKNQDFAECERTVTQNIADRLDYTPEWCRKRFYLRKTDRGALNSDQLIQIALELDTTIDDLIIYERPKTTKL